MNPIARIEKVVSSGVNCIRLTNDNTTFGASTLIANTSAVLFNKYMVKTQKELAFLRDLYIGNEWTRRFTDLIDKNFDLAGTDENLLYINAGTGEHAFTLRERLGDKVDIFATCEDEEILHIARDKAAALKSDVDFSMIRFENNSFDAVIADASFARPDAYEDLVEESVRVAKTGANIGILSVTSGSFGEIFSLLWEVLFNEDLGEHGHAAEERITELPTVSRVEEIAKRAGLESVQTHLANEVFEYENGAAFVSSPLVVDFLLPVWLRTLSDEEQERVSEKLAQLIDAEDGSLSFRFSVKATLVTGKKG
jgi:ubiquinone/menaquinone biosynthesis C-methylase UbiE